MSIRKTLLIAVTVLFAAVLSACSAGSPMLADHDVDISIDEAIAGQDALMMGAATGDIALTESEASSLITELLKQNDLDSVEIASITSEVDGDVNTLTVNLASPVGGIDTLGVSGSVVSTDGVLTVDLEQAWAGMMGVDSAVLDLISAQINASLAGMPMAGMPDGALAVPSDQAAMLSDMLVQMGLNSAEISAVKTHFDDGNIGIVGELASPVAGVDSLGLSIALDLSGGAANLAVNEAFAGNMVADSAMVDMIASQINSQLSGILIPSVSLDAESGELMISLGQ